MEIFKTADYAAKANPETGKLYLEQLLENKSENLVGFFGVLPPGGQVPYHFHEKRESVIIFISGKATELVEGEETPIQAGDVLFMPARQKHCIINRTNEEIRYLEFQVGKPAEPDFIEVE